MKGCYAPHPRFDYVRCVLPGGHAGEHEAYEASLDLTRISRRWSW